MSDKKTEAIRSILQEFFDDLKEAIEKVNTAIEHALDKLDGLDG